jgi:hypothetical protein
MTTKPVFPALGAPMSLAWVHESPAPRNWHCQNLSKAAISASTRLSSGGSRIRDDEHRHSKLFVEVGNWANV